MVENTICNSVKRNHPISSSILAQWKRAGLITRRASDRNGEMLRTFVFFFLIANIH
ncbi:hypothetical protein F4809DRAFT_623898 [Biscogniauxia mediterranea]|nr:hypothetical protein F4809DRAFT_623898 [Biscogniauxia mediterranea]